MLTAESRIDVCQWQGCCIFHLFEPLKSFNGARVKLIGLLHVTVASTGELLAKAPKNNPRFSAFNAERCFSDFSIFSAPLGHKLDLPTSFDLCVPVSGN